ncbi:MAG TPA: hypothetical protein VKU00_02470, partial [Chthonomonadaceae bacterium]|nr:hypothetical protein [Chthonomonadaceae bacterium]
AVGQRQTERAARLWAAAESLREAAGSPLSPNAKEAYDSRVAAVQTLLGEPAFSAAWETGRAMTTEQAIAYALEEDQQECFL